MTQRKLTGDERQIVTSASWFLTKAVGLCGGTGDCWRDASRQLGEMLNTGTTDGKPYVEPEPPIPGGYRLAVAGDEGRIDRKYWADSLQQWVSATCMAYRTDVVFIAPIDATPTDEDASQLPLVMVRDYPDRPWEKSRLVRVSEGGYTCLAASRRNFDKWAYCRHLYPGE